MTAATGEAPEGHAELQRVLVVGAGLVGASVGLALRARGVQVFLTDRDPAAVALAEELGAGFSLLARTPQEEPDLVVLATPPKAVVTSLIEQERLYLHATFTDVASVKYGPQAEIELRGADASRFVGGHPLAGRERSGAGAARADLFEGRPWVLTPSASSTALAVQRAESLVRLCGGQLVTMTPERHDEAVALVSHVPQLVASLTAGRLADAAADLVALSGQGIRDVTRIAASDPALWVEIVAANAAFVGPVLDALAADLDALRAELAAVATSASGQIDKSRSRSTERILRQGNTGYHRIPGKHGAPPATYALVRVVIPDSPGELARLLVASGAAGVNVEDVAIEHSPGQPVGLVELAVRPSAAATLTEALRGAGWSVHD